VRKVFPRLAAARLAQESGSGYSVPMIDTIVLDRYAEVLVKVGVNIRPGQCLLINTAAGNYEFSRRIAHAAYKNGAKFVRINVTDNYLTRYRVEHGKPDDLDWVPNYILNESYEFLANDWARIRIDSTEELDVLAGVDASLLARIQFAQRNALKRQMEAMMRDQHSWLVAAAPGPKWARHVFRNSGKPYSDLANTLSDDEITDRFWDLLKPILRLDHADPVKAWNDHMTILTERCRKLDSLKLTGLHFVNPDTDLFVGTNSTALWKGGRGTLPDGRHFLANLPTEEVFTTPDYRKTKGRAKACRPVSVLETLVTGAWFEFENGKIIRAGSDTEAGTAILNKFLAMDDGSSFLGEVALVAGESPIFRSGLLFGSILYDENASCHIAIGAGYPSCLTNAASLSGPADLKAAGCNVSMVHTDFMIGTPETDVFGVTADGRDIPIIKKGSFVI